MSPISRKGKYLRLTAGIAVLAILLFFIGRYVLYIKVKNTIEYELRSLAKQGIHISYENLEVYPWDGKIEVHQLNLKVRKDSVLNDSINQGLNAYLPYVTIEGIDLVPFLQDNTLSVHRIHSFETYVTYRINSTLFELDKSYKRKIEVKNISVDEVNFPRVDFYLTDEKQPDTVAHMLADIEMRKLFLSKQLDSLTWKKGEVDISNFAMNYKKDNYGLSVKKVKLGIADKSVEVDSFLIKPLTNRETFMRIAGKQCSYLEASVPHLKLKSIDWYTYPTATLQVDRVNMQLIADMYRDKRLPFLQREERALPSHFLHRIPIRLKIDTLVLSDSFVRYEEMPENGDSTGVVFFDKVHATIHNIHNNKKLKVDARMHTVAKFMGTGDLDAHFTFPYDTLHSYHVAGTLKNMDLIKINKVLGAVAQVKVASGIMRNFKFHFAYNNTSSEGEVELSYDDVKLLSLRENKKNEQSVSRVKTLLLNTFIIRKNLDEEAKDDTRKGIIGFNRDRRKSVFNFWWKSILSGIRSAYSLDKLPLNAMSGDNVNDRKKRKGLKDVFSRIFDRK
jgi:hypothetical protein